MNLARLQHSINWFRNGGHFDVELFEKAAKAIENRQQLTPPRRNRVLSIQTVNYNK